MKPIEIPFSEKPWRGLTEPDGAMPCIVCRRPIVITSETRYLHVCLGGGHALAGPPGGDPYCERRACLAYYPIGAECLRKHPELRPYAGREMKEEIA